MILRELIAKIGFQADEAPLKRIESAIDSVRQRLELLAAFEIGKKMVEMAEQFGEWGHELENTAEGMGITTTELQKMQAAAGRFGVDGEELNRTLSIMARHLYAVQHGTEGAEAAWKTFNKVGLSPETVLGFKTAQDAFYGVADATSKIQDPLARTAMLSELGGRGAYKMAALFKHSGTELRAFGDSAEKQGRIVGKDGVENLASLGLAFNKLHSFVNMFWADLAAKLSPMIEYVVDHLQSWYVSNEKLIKSKISEWLEEIAFVVGIVIGAILGLIMDIKELGEHPALVKFILWAGGALVLLQLLAGPVKLIMSLFSGGIWVWGKIAYFLPLIVGLIGDFVGWIGGLVGVWFPALGEAITAFGAAMSGLGLAAIAGWIAIIAAAVVEIHDLWAVATGKPTWVGQMWELMDKLPVIGPKIKALKDFFHQEWDKWGDTAIGKFIEDAIGAFAHLDSVIGFAFGGPIGAIIGAGIHWLRTRNETGESNPVAKAEQVSAAVSGSSMFQSFESSTSDISKSVGNTINNYFNIGHAPPGVTNEQYVATISKQVAEEVKKQTAESNREIHRSVPNSGVVQ